MTFKSLTTPRPHYPDSDSLNRLPHVAETEKGAGRFWNQPTVKDYAEACDVGREIAAHYLTYMHDQDDRSGMGIGHLPDMILALLDKANTELDEDQRGIIVGFGRFMDHYIAKVARSRDPWTVYRELEQYWAECRARDGRDVA